MSVNLSNQVVKNNSSVYTNTLPLIFGVTATTTLTSAQANGLIFIVSAAAAVTINLPAVASSNGIRYYIRLKAAPANAVTIHAATAVLQGSVVSSDGTAVTGGVVAAKSNIIIGTTAKAGDGFDLVSDGTNWYVFGWTGLNTAITFS